MPGLQAIEAFLEKVGPLADAPFRDQLDLVAVRRLGLQQPFVLGERVCECMPALRVALEQLSHGGVRITVLACR
jgi:hypothetical protein